MTHNAITKVQWKEKFIFLGLLIISSCIEHLTLLFFRFSFHKFIFSTPVLSISYCKISFPVSKDYGTIQFSLLSNFLDAKSFLQQDTIPVIDYSWNVIYTNCCLSIFSDKTSGFCNLFMFCILKAKALLMCKKKMNLPSALPPAKIEPNKKKENSLLDGTQFTYRRLLETDI